MSINKRLVPPIKCQGIKTKLVTNIIDILPDGIDGNWIEPFMGSGVVAFNVRPQKAILADSNPHLIKFYIELAEGKITSGIARNYLENEGKKLLEIGSDHYYYIRDRFNETGTSLDFLFLNRAGFNGMIRFNRHGKFNIPFCQKTNRFSPAYITKICNQIDDVSKVCSLGNYKFVCQDYEKTIGSAKSEDVIYCDPPYIARHTDYFNSWAEEDELKLANLLGNSKARFILSTWHSNEYRKNDYINTLWKNYTILTIEHFYHVGAKEKNRKPMLEALVLNFDANFTYSPSEKMEQLVLLEESAKYLDK